MSSVYIEAAPHTDLVFAVYSDPRTVFNLVDMAVLTGESRFNSINQRVNYYVRTGKLLNPRSGLFLARCI
ncbi:MAG: hypothetical protein LBS97_04840 [Treponema sp.]|nr:hypothetical protein [Treponema sp.]